MQSGWMVTVQFEPPSVKQQIHRNPFLNSCVARISALKSSSLNWQASNKAVFSQYWYFNLFSFAPRGKSEKTLHRAALKAHRRRPGRKRLSTVTPAKEVREWTLKIYLRVWTIFPNEKNSSYYINNMLVEIPAPTVYMSELSWVKTLTPKLLPMGLTAPCMAVMVCECVCGWVSEWEAYRKRVGLPQRCWKAL